MTTTTTTPPPEERAVPRRLPELLGWPAPTQTQPSLAVIAEAVSVAVALGMWLFFVTPRGGGRDPDTMLPAVLTLLPALILTAPWRRLGVVRLVVPLWLSLAATGVCLLSPYTWSGASSAALWGYGAVLFLIVAAFTRSDGRRTAVLALVAGAGLIQFTSGWLAWWGGGDPAKSMVGTFYYPNTFGAFILTCGVVAAVGCVLGPRQVQAVCWAAAPFALCSALLSTTRTVLILLVLAMVGLALVAVWDANRKLAVLRWAGVLALTAGAFVLLTGPSVFPGSSSTATSGFERRAAESGSLDTATTARLDWWRSAVAEAKEYPLAGGGFGSFAHISDQTLPAGQVQASKVHNQVLEGFAEGGVLFGVPLALAVFGLIGAGLRGAGASVLRRTDQRWATVAAGSAAAVLLAHSFVDFDFAFPAALGLAAIVGGCVPVKVPASPGVSRYRRPAGVVSVVALSAALVAAYVAQAGFRATADTRPEVVTRLSGGSVTGFDDPTLMAKALARAVPIPVQPGGLTASEADVRVLLRRTARIAPLQSELAMRRAVAFALLGEDQLAREIAADLYERFVERSPYLSIGMAEVLRLTGAQATALEVLVAQFVTPAVPRPRLEPQLVNVLQHLRDVDRPDGVASGCAYQLFVEEFGRPPGDQPAPIPLPSEVQCRTFSGTGVRPISLRTPSGEGAEDR